MRADDKSKPRIYGVTASHVLLAVGDEKIYDRAELLKLPLHERIVTAISARDSVITHLSQKRRIQIYEDHINKLVVKLQNVPSPSDSDEVWDAYQQAYRLHQRAVKTFHDDCQQAEENLVAQRKIGEIFLTTGTRAERFSDAEKSPLTGDSPFAMDYGLIEMDPSVAHRCTNAWSKERHPFPANLHPAAMDIVRTHMEALSLGRLGEEAGPEEPLDKVKPRVVIKPGGRTTSTTFGMLNEARIKEFRLKYGETEAMSALPISSGKLFGSGGDSGSAILNSAAQVVGILTSGKSGRPDKPIAILPLQVMRVDLEKKFGFTMELYTPQHWDGTRRQIHPKPQSITIPSTTTRHAFAAIPAGSDGRILDADLDLNGDIVCLVSSSEFTAGPDWCNAMDLDPSWDSAMAVFVEGVSGTNVNKPALPRLIRRMVSRIDGKGKASATLGISTG